ncbi:MAG: sigma-54 dependent transcriptional regulator [Gemmatimonadota bacterium]|nr:sigma-54 dependent transcriptional regulator [Gemmatimonadota bacterium]
MLPTIYILDDDVTFAKVLAINLGQAGRFKTEIFTTSQELLDRRAESPPHAVITDLVMPEVDGIEVTRRLRTIDALLPIFVLTAYGEMETAIEALKAGATEYLTKPVNIDELTTLLRRSLAEQPIREEVASLQQTRKQSFSTDAILGDHALVQDVRQFVHRVAQIPHPTVLLFGESGTGKNLCASAIHYSSPHSTGRLVEINCSALPSQLLEGELFGHQKGAFTDAKESKRGLIEVANGGTLFLDEIGDLSPELQSKLLNFIESRRFRRVGGTEEMEVTLRIITATNRNLEELVRDGKFREDLYYRIRVATHTLPSLRVIKDDLPVLAEHFREFFNREFRKDVREIRATTMELLQQWDWPGNVRELRNVIERAMIFADGTSLEPSDLPAFGIREGTPAPGPASQRSTVGLSLAEMEKEHIRRTLTDCDGSIQQAAQVLGVSRKTLWEKRKKYGLLE